VRYFMNRWTLLQLLTSMARTVQVWRRVSGSEVALKPVWRSTILVSYPKSPVQLIVYRLLTSTSSPCFEDSESSLRSSRRNR